MALYGLDEVRNLACTCITGKVRWVVGPCLAFLTVLLSTSLLTTPASARDCGLKVRPGMAGGRWTSTRVPRFPAESQDGAEVVEQDIGAYAIDEKNPSRMFVTNGRSVMRSTDGGCGWKSVYSLPTIETTVSRLITSIEIGGAKDLYLTVASEVDPGITTQLGPLRPDQLLSAFPVTVLHSADDGRTWNEGLIPTPIGGWPVLRVAPDRPEVVYLAIQMGVQVQSSSPQLETFRTLVYRSGDAGATWELRSEILSDGTRPRAGGPPGVAFGLLVDPLDADDLWLWDPISVQRSSDGAATWTAVKGLDSGSFGQGAAAIDVFHRRGMPARVVVAPPLYCVPSLAGISCPAPFIFWSDDGGRDWRKVAVPWFVGSVAHGRNADSVVILTSANGVQDQRYPGRVLAYDRGSWIDISPPEFLPALKQLTPSADGTKIFARSKASVETYRGPGL